MLCCLYGFHTEDAYSSLGLTRVRYAVSLTLWLHPPNTRRKRPRVELPFLKILSTWVFQLKLLDIVTPRYLVELTLEICRPFKVYWNRVENFLHLIPRWEHFLTLKLSCQLFDHEDNWYRSFCKDKQFCELWISLYRIQSPAKRRKLAFIQISFIYNGNNTGPKIEPCGTPDKTGLEEDWVPFMETNWERLDRKAFIHNSKFPLIP